VDFISFSKRSDALWAVRLEKRGEHLAAWNPQEQTVAQFIELLRGYDAFITARYHGAVFASLLRRPVVCIQVEPKLRLIADLLGRGARLWHYPFSARESLNHMDDLERSCPDVVAALCGVVTEQGQLVEKTVDEVSQIVP
jgi:hypothetical protein